MLKIVKSLTECYEHGYSEDSAIDSTNELLLGEPVLHIDAPTPYTNTDSMVSDFGTTVRLSDWDLLREWLDRYYNSHPKIDNEHQEDLLDRFDEAVGDLDYWEKLSLNTRHAGRTISEVIDCELSEFQELYSKSIERRHSELTDDQRWLMDSKLTLIKKLMSYDIADASCVATLDHEGEYVTCNIFAEKPF